LYAIVEIVQHVFAKKIAPRKKIFRVERCSAPSEHRFGARKLNFCARARGSIE
jgi:hypothetical protein